MPLSEPTKFTELLHLRKTGQMKDLPGVGKIKLAKLCQTAGVQTPTIYRTFESAAALDLVGLPESFVLKPAGFSTRRGVMLLRHIGSGEYWEEFRRRRLSTEAIRSEQAAWEKLWHKYRKRPFILIAQERIISESDPSEIPLDYKLYVFGDDVRLIVQFDRNATPNSLAFFLNEFETFDYRTRIHCDWKLLAQGAPRLPRCHREMVDAAKKLSTSIPSAFISVDLYAGSNGAVVGEITRTPGGPYFRKKFELRPEFDAELGALWIDTAKRIGKSIPLIDAGERTKIKAPSIPGTIPGNRRGKKKNIWWRTMRWLTKRGN